LKIPINIGCQFAIQIENGHAVVQNLVGIKEMTGKRVLSSAVGRREEQIESK
jgi:hypothetical protein